MSNSNYTKISDKMVDKFGLKIAWIYAKLCYRMNLSRKNKKYFNNGYFVIFTEKELAAKCDMSRGSVIKYLKVLEKAHYVYKDPTLFANHLYLPKFKSDTNESIKNNTSESSKSAHSQEQRVNNQDSNNYVNVNSFSVSKARKYPSVDETIKKYGKKLYQYAIDRFHVENDTHLAKIYSPYHFVVGILRRWARKGIKDVNGAMQSEGDSRATYPDEHGPIIPIFKI